MKIFVVVAGLLFSIFFSTSTFAGLFVITDKDYGVLDPATLGHATIIGLVDTAFGTLETTINEGLPDTEASKYLDGMSNASLMASKGIGIDYSSDVKVAVLGGVAGVGADFGENGFGDLVSGKIDASQIAGVGVAVSAMAGFNLSAIPHVTLPKIWFVDLEKVNVYINYFGYSVNKNFNETSFTGDVSFFGLHAQYQLIGGKKILPFRMARWGGVKVSTGYEYGSMELSLSQEVNETISTDMAGTSVAVTYDGSVTIGAKGTTHSIPLEVTTDFQWLYFFTTYVGLATDISFGSAESIASVNGDITMGAIPGFTATGPSGKSSLDLGDSGGPNLLMFRTFVGQQFNFSILKVCLQLDHSIGTGVWGANIGLKLAW